MLLKQFDRLIKNVSSTNHNMNWIYDLWIVLSAKFLKIIRKVYLLCKHFDQPCSLKMGFELVFMLPINLLLKPDFNHCNGFELSCVDGVATEK